MLDSCCFQLSWSSTVMPSSRVDWTTWREWEQTESSGGGTAAEEMQMCITTVMVRLVDTLFTSVNACKLSRVACRGEKSCNLY